MLARYAARLTTIKMPAAYTFEYSFEHRGERPQDRHHRVYRESGRERDEILSVNGERLPRPQVRIFERRRDRYAIRQVAPRTDAYAFVYVGTQKEGRHINYVFNTFPRSASSYEVTRLTLDGASFLPRKIAFHTGTASIKGMGEIVYAKADRYWMPESASARAEVNGKLETETITWARYRFYPSFPPATFALPARASKAIPAG